MVEIRPVEIEKILEETNNIGFDQLSDPLLGSLLSTLSATKRSGCFLELGTGSGLSTAWILKGMDSSSTLTTIDSDEKLVSIAKKYLGRDDRVKFIIGKGEDLIPTIDSNSIDFIFADTWAGKYNNIEKTLSLLKNGGIYLIDDMLPRDSWTKGHDEKVSFLIRYLESRDDLIITKMLWSSGIVTHEPQILFTLHY